LTPKRRVGHVLAGSYAAACAVAAVYVAIQFIWSPGTSELAGVAFVLLGLPWTLAVPFLMRLGGSSAWVALIGIAASCVLNFWLLSRVGSR
jgi:hypothetical protein